MLRVVYIDSSETRRDSIARICFSRMADMIVLCISFDEALKGTAFIAHTNQKTSIDGILLHVDSTMRRNPETRRLLAVVHEKGIPAILAMSNTSDQMDDFCLPIIQYKDGLDLLHRTIILLS